MLSPPESPQGAPLWGRNWISWGLGNWEPIWLHPEFPRGPPSRMAKVIGCNILCLLIWWHFLFTASYNKILKYQKQKQIDIKGDTYKYITPLSQRLIEQEDFFKNFSKNIKDVNNTTSQLDPIDIYKTWCQITTKQAIFSCTYQICSRHILVHKNTSQPQKMRLLQSKIKVNNTKIFRIELSNKNRMEVTNAVLNFLVGALRG